MSSESGPDATHGRILVVCTGNVCRSPYLERVLAHELAGTGIAVSSAGPGALVSAPMDPQSARRLVAAGASPEGFLAQQITRDMVAAADLVIAATREHLSEVVPLHPRALRYSFALRDLGDLLAVVTPEEIAAAPGDNRVARVAAAAISKRGIVNPRLLEDSGVIDPFRRGPEVFDQMADEIADSLPAVVAALRSA